MGDKPQDVFIVSLTEGLDSQNGPHKSKKQKLGGSRSRNSRIDAYTLPVCPTPANQALITVCP